MFIIFSSKWLPYSIYRRVLKIMLRQCRFLSKQEVRSIPEHKVWGADRHWRKPPLFAWPHSSFAVVCQGFAVDTEVSEWVSEWASDGVSAVVAALVLEASGPQHCQEDHKQNNGYDGSKDWRGFGRDPICTGFMGFKDLCPGVSSKFVPGRRMSRNFPSHKNAICLAMPTNIPTSPQWEKTYTGVGRQSPSR
jgi:hypothetical protein